MSVTEHYWRMRRETPTMPARWVLQWARTAAKVDELQRDGSWEEHTTGDRPFDHLATFTLGGLQVRVYRDDEDYDWGDTEPTDYERENLEVFGVSAGLVGEDDLDVIWSCSLIAPTCDDIERMALETALDYGFIARVEREQSERCYWSACDVITVA